MPVGSGFSTGPEYPAAGPPLSFKNVMGAVGSFTQGAVRFGSFKSAGRAIPMKDGSPNPTRLPALLAGVDAAEAAAPEEDGAA